MGTLNQFQKIPKWPSGQSYGLWKVLIQLYFRCYWCLKKWSGCAADKAVDWKWVGAGSAPRWNKNVCYFAFSFLQVDFALLHIYFYRTMIFYIYWHDYLNTLTSQWMPCKHECRECHIESEKDWTICFHASLCCWISFGSLLDQF